MRENAMLIWQRNVHYNPLRTPKKLECNPKESVLLPGQLSSGVASLFLDTTPAVLLVVTAVST